MIKYPRGSQEGKVLCMVWMAIFLQKRQQKDVNWILDLIFQYLMFTYYRKISSCGALLSLWILPNMIAIYTLSMANRNKHRVLSPNSTFLSSDLRLPSILSSYMEHSILFWMPYYLVKVFQLSRLHYLMNMTISLLTRIL